MAFFPENYGANAADQLAADVHTDVPCDICNDPGSVLHQGIGISFRHQRPETNYEITCLEHSDAAFKKLLTELLAVE